MTTLRERLARIPRWVRIGGLALLVAVLALVGWLILSTTRQPANVATANIVYAGDMPTEVQVTLLLGQGREQQGVPPWQVTVTPGTTYQWRASAPGYRLAVGEFAVPVSGGAVAVEIPALAPAAGMILVVSNVTVTVQVDGQEVGTVAAGPQWVSFGPYPEGNHTVTALTELGAQTKTAAVSAQFERKVEFLWGSRLEITVQPSGLPDVTITVDDRPYTGPREFTANDLSSRPFVQVGVQASGYARWADTVFLLPGKVTTVAAQLVTATVAVTTTPPVTGTNSAAEDEVRAALDRYWVVLADGYRRMDASGFATAMAGDALAVETQTIGTLAGVMQSIIITPSVQAEPVIQVAADGQSATASVSYLWTQVFVQTDGTAIPNPPTPLNSVFTFALSAEGWLVVQVDSAAAPTPTSTGGGNGDGGGPPATPPDRGLVKSVVLASMNCLGGPYAADPELDAVLAPFAERATRESQSGQGYSQALEDEVNAALQPLGARVAAWHALPLSYVKANAQYGMFAYDWPNYVNDPCATHYADPWIGNVGGSHIGIAIGTPYLAGGVWQATIIIVWR